MEALKKLRFRAEPAKKVAAQPVAPTKPTVEKTEKPQEQKKVEKKPAKTN